MKSINTLKEYYKLLEGSEIIDSHVYPNNIIFFGIFFLIKLYFHQN